MHNKEIRSKIYTNLVRFEEDHIYQKDLLSSTIFPYMHLFTQAKMNNAVLNFSLKEVDFNKKKALVFFLALELLTNQKCVATLSSKNVLV
jgi:ribosomal protein L5